MSPQNQELATIIQSLIDEIKDLKTKVEKLTIHSVTREDLEKVRQEIVGNFVPRDSYEPRHAALIERDLQLESLIREFRKENEVEMDRIHERLESGKQQLEDRMRETQNIQLSQKDRAWIRISQLVGLIAILIAVLEWLVQHARFN